MPTQRSGGCVKQAQQRYYTLEEYLAQEKVAEFRSEYYNGEWQ